MSKTRIDWITLSIYNDDVKITFHKYKNLYSNVYYLKRKSASLLRLYKNFNNREDFDVAFYDKIIEIDFRRRLP